MQWATNDLDEATRARVRQILEEQRPAAQTLRHDLRAIDQRLMTVIRASTLDPEALNATLSDLRRTNGEIRHCFTRLWNRCYLLSHPLNGRTW